MEYCVWNIAMQVVPSKPFNVFIISDIVNVMLIYLISCLHSDLFCSNFFVISYRSFDLKAALQVSNVVNV